MIPTRVRRALVAASLVPVLVSLPTTAHAAVAAPAAVAVAAKAAGRPFVRAPKPTIVGVGAVGAVLHVAAGRWTPKPHLAYRWRVDGYTVAGATQRTYTVRAQDAGARITAVVHATRHGYRPTERTSAALQVAVPVPAPTSSAPAPTPAPTSSSPAPAPSPTSSAPGSPVAIAGDGDYRIGVTVAPGTYVTTGATSSCYWERVTSFDGQYSSIIANDLGSGQRIVTVDASDYGIRFSDCASWVRAADAPAAPTVSTGQYLVGAQIPTGLYSARPSAAGCYWALLSAFDGSASSIIANDYRSDTGAVLVQVGADVRGFESSGCGVWTRVSS